MTKQKNLNDQASLSAPLEDLQVRITFLDDLVEQLNEQVTRQNAEIADLKKQMQFLYQRIISKTKNGYLVMIENNNTRKAVIYSDNVVNKIEKK